MTFAPYREHERGRPWHHVSIRKLAHDDVETVASIFAERERRPLPEARSVVARWVDPSGERTVLVAEHAGEVRGYGKSQLLTPRARGGDAPTGWYLAGLVVAPDSRRHGLGALLTAARLDALAAVTDEVWFFANLRNHATVALHERFGFVLHTRAFTIPDVHFDGGEGGLFRLALPAETSLAVATAGL